MVRTGALVAVMWLTVGCVGTAPDVEQQWADERREASRVLSGIPEVPVELRERLGQYLEVRSGSLQGWLPDGELLISTRFGETTQIHRVARPGGAREQLTFFPEPVPGALPSPDANRPGFLFLRDAGGSEFFQLYFFDLATGRVQLQSDGDSRNSSPVWAPSGERFAWSSTVRNGRDTDIWVGALDGDMPRALVTAGGTWFAQDFSADGSRLLVQRYVSRSESHPFVVDVASGELTRLFAEDFDARIDRMRFGPEGSVYFSSDAGGEFVRLYRQRVPGAEPQPVTGEVAHDLESFELSPDGRYLAWTLNEDARSRLYVRRLDSGAFVALPRLPEGLISGLDFSRDGNMLGFTLNTATSPGDVHSIDLRGRNLTRWTRSEVGGLDTDTFLDAEHFAYPTFDTPDGGVSAALDDRRQIPAFIYRPEGPGPHPVVVQIHGGPEAQARPGFSSVAQFWARELGFAVVVPNVRGSTGYGRSFHRLDNGVLREDSVRDIGALLDWIGTQEDLDAERVAVFGGSYGGYMVLASLIHFGDQLRAGVNVVGISNFVTFLENTQDYRRDLRRAEYGDERDPKMRAFLERISPLTHVARITDPLLVVQGANDPRVPRSEAEQIVSALREGGHEVGYLLALDEGHGFRKRSNRDAYLEITADFLRRQLQ